MAIGNHAHQLALLLELLKARTQVWLPDDVSPRVGEYSWKVLSVRLRVLDDAIDF